MTTSDPSDRKREKFLEALALMGNVSRSCRAASVAVGTVYLWRKQDEAFAALWDEALEEACDKLEAEAWRRAVEGVEVPLMRKGQPVIDEDGAPVMTYTYSDRLLELLLKGNRSRKYRDRLEHSGDDKKPVRLIVTYRDPTRPRRPEGASPTEVNQGARSLDADQISDIVNGR